MPRRWKSSDLVVATDGKLRAKNSGPRPEKILKTKFQGIVMGVDPSLRGTGVAVLRVEDNEARLLFSTTIKTKGNQTAALAQIAQSIHGICRQYKPDAAAIEETIYVQNNKTAIILGTARGAALASLALNQVECRGFAPARIKQSVVGHGRASKQQVAAMTKTLLKIADPLPFDEADAAAAALCLVFTYAGCV
jgi:crossover junction endodeoxyribonuclease RuvC